ncbi:MAG: hypothetical protein HY609_02410 [Deltaproteobacteria bacterium]|nr:hypothetical protein [Deltaproteobacteria bacterium]MBI4223761.1 hypothetical protein [Deltaproteobacteria bacterium]
MTIPSIKPDIVPVDIDFPKAFLPVAVTCPVGAEMCGNKAYIQTVRVEDGTNALRVQFHSEVPGLWGRKGRGWSHYAIYLEEGGKIYARRAAGPNGAQDGPAKYSVANPKWAGAPQRVAEVIANVVGGWETLQRLRSPSSVAANPAYQLALWLESHQNEALASIPAPLLEGVFILGDQPVKLPIDLDDNSDAGFPPSLGLVHGAAHTVNDNVSVWKEDSSLLRFHFASELDNPELGMKPFGPTREGQQDLPAPSFVLLAPFGMEVRDVARPEFGLSLETPPDRLALIVAGALVAVGNYNQPEPAAMALFQAALHATTEGKLLPETDRFEPGEGFNVYKAESWGEGAILYSGHGGS